MESRLVQVANVAHAAIIDILQENPPPLYEGDPGYTEQQDETMRAAAANLVATAKLIDLCKRDTTPLTTRQEM